MGLIRDPSRQAFLLIVIVGLIYAILARPVERVTDFELANTKSGTVAYVGIGPLGLRVVDVTEESSPTMVGAYNTYGYVHGLDLKDNYIYLAAGWRKVFVLDVSAAPKLIARIRYFPGRAYDVSLSGNKAYIAAGGQGVRIFDVSDPRTAMEQVGSPIVGDFDIVETDHGRLFAVDGGKTLRVFQIAKDTIPNELGSYPLDFEIHDILVQGDRIYLAADEGGLIVLDISLLENKNIPKGERVITPISQFDTPGRAMGVDVKLPLGYIADGSGGIVIVDLTDINSISLLENTDTLGTASRVRAIGDHIYLGDGVAGFYVLDSKVAYQLESSYSSLTSTSTNQGNRGLDKDDRYIYMADHQRGMRVYTATPNELKAVSSYTGGKGNSTVDVAVNRGVAYIASIKDFTAVDVSQPEAQINLLDSLVPPDVEETYSVIVDDHFAYLTLGETGLAVIDVSDPANLGLPIVEKLPSDRSAMGLDALGSHVYIASQSPGAEGRGGLDVVSVVDPTIPSSLGYVSLPGDPLNVDAITFLDGLYGVDPATPGARIYIYIATGRAGVQLVDASDVNNLVLLQLADLFPTGTRVVDVFTTGNRLYAIGITPTNSGVFYAFGAVSPDNLQIIGQPLDLIGLPSRLIVEGEFAYITTQGHGLQVVKIDPEGNHNIIPSYTPSSAAKWLTLQTLEGTDGAVADQPVELKTYIYVVDGYKNLRILELNRTGAVKETGSFDQLTAAQHIVVQGNFAYIADGIGGIRILSVQDRTMPISMAQLFEPVGAQYIAVHGNYAYVASGFGGLWVVDISDPLAPKAVKNVPFNCEANLVGVNRGDHLLLGCRGVGLISLRLVDPINPQYVSAYTQYADIEALMLVGNYAFLSLGESGLVVLDVTNPEDMQVVSHYPSDGEPRNVMYADLVKSIVFLSIQDGGIEMVDFKDLNNPALLSIYFIEGFSAEMIQALWIPPEAGGGGQGYFGIFVAAGDKGLEMHTATMSVAIDFLGMYETPGSATPAMVLHNLGVRAGRGGQLVNDVLYKKGTWTMWRVPFEFVIIGGLGLLIWMALFAQHVLPVESLDERKQAIRQLRAYLFGNQSLIVRTRDGSVLEPERLVKTKPSGSGVALVDLSSAIVLYGRSWLSPRPKGQGWFAGLMRSIARGQPVNNGDKREKESLPHARVVGPGLVFTEPGEFIGVSPYDKDVFDIADLHPQVRIDKNVCTATQDGIEVKTDVFCIFNLGEAPDVLRVTYEDSSSEPDKIRVVYAEEGSKKDAHSKRVHGLRVQKLVDELDGDDKFEIHRYIQDAKKKGQKVESVDLYSTEPYLKFQKLSTMDTPDITGLIEILEGRYKLDPYDNNKYLMHLYFLINELVRDLQFDKQKIAKYIPPIQLLFDYPSRIYKPETKRNHNFIRLIGELIELRKDNKHLVRDKNNNTIKGKLDLYKVNQKRANLVQMNITNSMIKDIRDWVEKLDGDIKRACIEYLLSPYGYNEERIFSALASRAIEDDNGKLVEWTKLPPMVATNILRDMVTDEKYDLLFLPMDPVKYPLDMNFKPKFRNKVRNQGVLSYQYIENKLLNGKQKLIKKGDILTKDQTNQYPIQELKTPKVLRVHGIKVLFTSFSELQPVDTQVYDHLFEAWSSRWERAATIQMSDFDKRARRIRYKGRIQAQQDIILSFAKIFKQNKNSREALAIRIFQALESTLTDPLSRELIPEETVRMFRTLFRWL